MQNYVMMIRYTIYTYIYYQEQIIIVERNDECLDLVLQLYFTCTYYYCSAFTGIMGMLLVNDEMCITASFGIIIH